VPVRILFLEDNATDFELVSEFIVVEGLDCRIVRAVDKQTFERLFDPAEFDLILSDYALPGYSGFAALEHVRRTDEAIPFILLSGTLSEEEAVDSLHAGATDYIIKGRLHRLAPAIERALREAKIRRQNIQAHEALRASEERFKLAARATNEAIWEWDLASDEIWCNDTFDVLFGYNEGSRMFSAQEKISRIGQSDQPRVAGRLQEMLRSNETLWVEEYEFQRRDGSFAQVLDRAMIYRDDVGRPVRLIGAMSDITHRRKAEAQIREQAELLDKARDAIVLIGMDQRILYWNQSAERIFGWSGAEAVGKHVSEFLLARNLPNEKGVYERLLAENEWRGEFEVRTKSGKRIIVDSHWSLMRDAQDRKPRGILLINTDVTEKKELETQFLRAQRIETIGTLSGGIAHDLNNALAPIVMASELLSDEIKSDSGRRMLEMVRTSANRCGEMVKQILSFSRGAGQGWELLDPCKIVDELAGLCRETFTRMITIKVRCEPRVNRFHGNLTQMHQVLMNVLVNARDAMPRGGEIRINVKNVVLRQHANRMLAKPASGPFISIAVTDSGSGIAPEIMARIFEPFFTTKEIGKGTGLGLSTVFSILKSHEGFVEVRSEVGKGTTFELFMPGHAREEVAGAQITTAAMSDARGEQLLIVDDEAGLLAMVKTTLETVGYRAVTAPDGLAALTILEKSAPEIDLVITDWQMPLMSGAELVRKIQGTYPELKMVVATGAEKVEDVSGLFVNGLLQKPYTTEGLLKVIREVLVKAAPMGAASSSL
jgi:PAS domain S-box-containing protein